jgi:spore coat protein U-like protein
MVGRFFRLLILLAVPGLLLGAAPARAQTATTTFSVTANANANCLISGNTLAFGAFTGIAAAATATLSVTCTNTTGYNIGLNAGTGTGATVINRLLTGPSSATLAYALFQDSGHLLNWGQTVGTDTVSGTGNGSAQTLTIYGLVLASQFPAPGSYSDTVTATITY